MIQVPLKSRCLHCLRVRSIEELERFCAQPVYQRRRFTMNLCWQCSGCNAKWGGNGACIHCNNL